MDYAQAALVALCIIALLVIIWRQQVQIRASMELLASRSFGEYAQGRAKLDGTEKPPKPFDPGF